MVVHCYTWIFHLFRRVICINDDDVEYFINVPDDVTENILSRVPAETVRQCQRVCKHWHKLTSSSRFTALQLQKRNEVRPVTLMHVGLDHPKLFIIDGKTKKECKVRAPNDFHHAKYVGSCNGLVLFVSCYYKFQFFVFNPLSSSRGERMIILDTTDTTLLHDYLKTGCRFSPCGFFFHPLAKEFRILSCVQTSTCNVYYLYLCGAKMWRRTADPYFDYIPSPYSCGRNCIFRTPAIVDGGLHWYTSDRIMIFDMVSEKFSIKPLPIEKASSNNEGIYFRDLLVEKDQLCFCNLRYHEKALDIWILNDYSNWSWTRKYTVDLDSETKYPMKIDLTGLSVLSIHKDELILYWRYRGLFSYHLGSNSINRNVVKVEIDRYSAALNRQLYWGYEAYKP